MAEPRPDGQDGGVADPNGDAELTEGDDPDAGDGSGGGGGPDGSDADPDPLLVWALSTFHVATLVVLPVWLAHAVAPAAVGGLLDSLGTLPGVGVYLTIWAATWWSNRAWLREADLADGRGAVAAGAKWGAPTGVAALLAVLAVLAIQGLGVFVAVVAAIGIVVATLVGAVVGGLFAGLDVALYRISGALVPE
mgnify:CR=1 FL=1